MSSFHIKKNNFLKIRNVNKNVDLDEFQQNDKKREFCNFKKSCVDEKNWYICIEFVHWFIDVDVRFFICFIFLNVSFFRCFFFFIVLYLIERFIVTTMRQILLWTNDKWTKNWSCYSQTKYLSKKNNKYLKKIKSKSKKWLIKKMKFVWCLKKYYKR